MSSCCGWGCWSGVRGGISTVSRVVRSGVRGGISSVSGVAHTEVCWEESSSWYLKVSMQSYDVEIYTKYEKGNWELQINIILKDISKHKAVLTHPQSSSRGGSPPVSWLSSEDMSSCCGWGCWSGVRGGISTVSRVVRSDVRGGISSVSGVANREVCWEKSSSRYLKISIQSYEVEIYTKNEKGNWKLQINKI